MENPRVLVLLSTYNGERFLEEQLESVIKQEGVEVNILARDDGSSDGTTIILEKWSRKGLLSWYNGENIGPARSFLNLLENAEEYDYYAFCDQDDVWNSDKLSTAVSLLNCHPSKPALYFCQTQLVDENLNHIKSVIIHPNLSLGEALVYQFVGGCTMVMNNSLRETVIKFSPTYLTMHDVWVYDVAMAIGADIYFDSNPHILYRQHENNTTGQNASLWSQWKDRLRKGDSGRDVRSNLAKEILDGYMGIMPAMNIRLLKDFVDGKKDFGKRIKILVGNRYKCSDSITYILFKLSVLLNRY